MTEGSSPAPAASPWDTSDYKVFTRRFDRIVRAQDLDQALKPSARGLGAGLRAYADLEKHLEDWRRQLTLTLLDAADSIRSAVGGPALSDTVVALLIDQSGSMKGQKMLLTAAAVDVVQDFLANLNCKVEVLGFTTRSWWGGRPRWLWRLKLRPSKPGRLCELLHIIYRDAGELQGLLDKDRLAPMLRPDLLKENVDGEALLWAADRLRRRPERRKIILVISDGAPVDDATLLANGMDYLSDHLLNVLEALAAEGLVRVGCVHIGAEVPREYPAMVSISSPGDIGSGLMSALQTLLMEPAAAGQRTIN